MMKRKWVCEIDESHRNADGPSSNKMPSEISSNPSPETWLRALRNAKKSCTVAGGTRRVHYKFDDGREMLEEYTINTGCVTRRAWSKSNSTLGGPPEWSVEVGEPTPAKPLEMDELREASDQPIITRRNTRNNLEWRIRNLSYPIEVYSVAANANEKCLIVKTTNKKYYKKLSVPELERVGLTPVQANIQFTHKFNTLIITYKKPTELQQLEKTWLDEINKMESEENPIDECKQS